jgi:hypothetical protein
MSPTILRQCDQCGRETAHDPIERTVVSRRGKEIHLKVHFCSVHEGARDEAVKHLDKIEFAIT